MSVDNKYAAKVREYWKALGYTVSTQTSVSSETSNFGNYHTARSDLHNGLPWNFKGGDPGIPLSFKRTTK